MKAYRFLIVLLLVLIVMILTVPKAVSQSGDVINACYNKKNGSLRKVNSAADCSSQESFVFWNIAGPTGPKGDTGATGARGVPGPTGPQGPQGGGLQVFDANNSFVGNVVGTMTGVGGFSYPVISAAAGGFTFLLKVEQYNLTTTDGGGLYIYYEGLGCTGRTYFMSLNTTSPEYRVFPIISVGPPDFTVYRMDEASGPVSAFLSSQSTYDAGGGPSSDRCGGCCGATFNDLRPALPMIKLDFTPPFRVVLVP